MASEEVKIKLGLDSSPLSRALTGVVGMAKRAGASIGRALTSGLGLTLGAAGLTTALSKALGFADQLKSTAESLNISTDFLQGFQRFAQDNGGGIEMANKALEKLSRLVGEAKSGSAEAVKTFARFGITLRSDDGTFKEVSEIMGDIADRLKNSKSGSEQAAIAFDLLGKGSVKLAAGLKQGSEAMKEFIENAPKLSRQQIDALDEAKDSIERAGANITLVFAEAATSVGLLVEAFARAKREGLSVSEAAGKIRDEAVNAEFGDSVWRERKRMLEASDDLRAEITKRELASIAAISKAETDAAKKEADEAMENFKLRDELENRKDDIAMRHFRARERLMELEAGGMMTLGEAASQDPSRYNATGRRNIMNSQRVEQLRRFAQENRLQGNFGLASQQESLAESISNSLAPFLRDPQREALQEAKAQVAELKAVNTQLESGVKIQTD